MGARLSFSIKSSYSPHVFYNNPKKNDLENTLQRTMNLAVGSIVSENLNKALAFTKAQLINIAATLFVRLCSRTPMDEEYVRRWTQGDGEEQSYRHIPDESTARRDWVLECAGRRLVSGDLMDSHPGMFNNFNSHADKVIVASELKKMIGRARASEIARLTISNFNEHFSILEYGGYEFKDGVSGQGALYEHGTENHHSVQAPHGIVRVAQLELASIIAEAKRKGVDRGYMLYSHPAKNLSESRIRDLINKLKRGGYIDMNTVNGIVDPSEIESILSKAAVV